MFGWTSFLVNDDDSGDDENKSETAGGLEDGTMDKHAGGVGDSDNDEDGSYDVVSKLSIGERERTSSASSHDNLQDSKSSFSSKSNKTREQTNPSFHRSTMVFWTMETKKIRH